MTLDNSPLVISPRDKRCLLELLPAHAGLCQRLAFTSASGELIQVMAPCSDAELAAGNPWNRGVWLYPFPSRLNAGRYSWQGKPYQLPLNESDRGNALHGFLTRINPVVVTEQISEDSASVTMRYCYDGSEPGYPFPADVDIEYHLQSPGKLTIKMVVNNRHDEPVPLGVGWHPYFTFGTDLGTQSLQLPAGDFVGVDERLLPTGDLHPMTQFAELTAIGDFAIDAPMKLKAEYQDQPGALLWSPSHQAGIVVWMDKGEAAGAGYSYLQVFTPPDRQSIALEPVSCGINAFNTGEHLLTLAPDASQAFTCGVYMVNEANPGLPAK